MNIRIKWLRDQLNSMKIDGMIVSNPANIRYLTGLVAEGTFIIAPRENVFITDSRYIEAVNNELTIDDEIIAYDIRNMSRFDYEGIFMGCSDVAFEEKFVTYEQYKRFLQVYQVNLVESEGLIENHRIIKDEDELDLIKKACEITDLTFKNVPKMLKIGITERELAFEIEKFMIENGADGLAFDSIVAFDSNTSVPHAVPSDKKLKSGSIIQFDIGAKYKGYCSDFSRVIFINYMKDEYKDVYDFVIECKKNIVNSFKESTNVKNVVKSLEYEYNQRGYSILHAFGHGVGLDIHEEPILSSKMDLLLKSNSILAIEPGVYKPGEFGIRIEDTYLITKEACINLTKSEDEYNIINI